jgi:hypothetical protein
MDLDHETDSAGRRTGRNLGFSHPRWNQSVNSFSKLGRRAHIDAALASQQIADREAAKAARHARREYKRNRAEYDRVQRAIAADDSAQPVEPASDYGRDW